MLRGLLALGLALALACGDESAVDQGKKKETKPTLTVKAKEVEQVTEAAAPRPRRNALPRMPFRLP